MPFAAATRSAGEDDMAFAPPKKSLTPGDGPDGPVRGRLARAAVGAAGGASFDDHDGLDDDGNAILGSKHLWLVESEDAPRSPGVATVAAVSRSPGRERPRSERVDAAKGPNKPKGKGEGKCKVPDYVSDSNDEPTASSIPMHVQDVITDFANAEHASLEAHADEHKSADIADHAVGRCSGHRLRPFLRSVHYAKSRTQRV